MSQSSKTSQISRIKVLTTGDAGTGKSCLVKRYCEGKFVSKYLTTIGCDYGVKPVVMPGGVGHVRVNFWDLGGDSAYAEVRYEFYKDAQVVCVVSGGTCWA